jgi:hypothetical protein
VIEKKLKTGSPKRTLADPVSPKTIKIIMS